MVVVDDLGLVLGVLGGAFGGPTAMRIAMNGLAALVVLNVEEFVAAAPRATMDPESVRGRERERVRVARGGRPSVAACDGGPISRVGGIFGRAPCFETMSEASEARRGQGQGQGFVRGWWHVPTISLGVMYELLRTRHVKIQEEATLAKETKISLLLRQGFQGFYEY